MEHTNCKNCGANLNGRFCAQCGQKLITERLTVRNIWSNFLAQLTNIETGFWHTTVMLFKAPWQVVEDVISGKTVRYYNPFRYVLIWATISVVLNISSGVFDAQQADIQEGMNELLGVEDRNSRQQEIQQTFQEEVKNWLNFIVLLLIPFMSLMTKWLFRKKEYNYAEHLVANTYLLGQTTLIGVPILFIFVAFPSLLPWQMWTGYLLTILFYTYASRKLFEVSAFGAFWRSTLAVILGNLMLVLTMGIIGGIVAIIYFLIQGGL